MSIGIWQIVVILLLVLIVFGAGKLPKVMGDVGKGMKNFKEGLHGEDDEKGDTAQITEKKAADTETAKDAEKSETKAG